MSELKTLLELKKDKKYSNAGSQYMLFDGKLCRLGVVKNGEPEIDSSVGYFHPNEKCFEEIKEKKKITYYYHFYIANNGDNEWVYSDKDWVEFSRNRWGDSDSKDIKFLGSKVMAEFEVNENET